MRVVLCNAPPDRAEAIAQALVERKLAACVNVLPGVVSIYRWRGAVERAEESTLLVKTRDDLLPALMDAIRKIHPYEVPEIVALHVDGSGVDAAYAAWVDAETS